MQSLNNRGLSQIVSIVLLIGVIIAAFAIISFYVLRLAHEPLYSPQGTCIKLELNSPLRINNVCYNENTKQIETTLSRSLNSNLTQIEFVKSSSKTEKWKCASGCPDCTILGEGETKTYYLDSSFEQDSTFIIAVDDCKLEEKKIVLC